jgi:hypothetical protein
VKWDDESRQHESSPAHLVLWTGDESESDGDGGNNSSSDSGDDSSGDESESNGDGGDKAAAEDRNPEAGMDERADGDVDVGAASEDEGTANDTGDDVTRAGGSSWRKVVGVGDDVRGDRARFGMAMKRMTVNSHTKRSDFWKELLPVDLDGMLKVVTEDATKHEDKGTCTKDGLLGFLCQLCGGCQFAVGTDLWTTTRKGMTPPPKFGEHGSKDKFRR